LRIDIIFNVLLWYVGGTGNTMWQSHLDGDKACGTIAVWGWVYVDCELNA